MSKERLDAIKDRAMFKQLAKRTGEITHSLFTLDADDYDWLIEQAERVRELEKDIKEWEIVNESWEEINTHLVEQNKRYRERIEYMLEEAKDHKRKGLRIQHWALIKDLEETLEGEEW